MNLNSKFNLTNTHKKEGFTLTIVWGGGLSCVKTQKGVSKTGKPVYLQEKVQKLVQSLHNFTPDNIKHWLHTCNGSHWTNQKEWSKMSERERVEQHLLDYIHDLSQTGCLLSWYVK